MRFRRHVRPARAGNPRSRRLLRDAGIVAVVALLGFGAGTLWLSPVPVVSSSGSVPRLIGLELDAARRELTALGYRAAIADAREHADARRGAVIAQDPPPGVALPAGGTVTVTPSAGPAQLPVPDLVGLDAALAERILDAAGLAVGAIDSVADPGADLGVVLGTRPSAGAGRRAGDAVDLIINGRER